VVEVVLGQHLLSDGGVALGNQAAVEAADQLFVGAVVVIVPPGIGVCGLPRWRAPWTVIAGTATGR
jgi:hypothetical protein